MGASFSRGDVSAAPEMRSLILLPDAADSVDEVHLTAEIVKESDATTEFVQSAKRFSPPPPGAFLKVGVGGVEVLVGSDGSVYLSDGYEGEEGEP